MLSLKEWEQLPVSRIEVDKYYHTDLEEECDEEAVKQYMKQIKTNNYEPIWVRGNTIVDGCHRIIAAHRLGIFKLRAHINLN